MGNDFSTSNDIPQYVHSLGIYQKRLGVQNNNDMFPGLFGTKNDNNIIPHINSNHADIIAILAQNGLSSGGFSESLSFIDNNMSSDMVMEFVVANEGTNKTLTYNLKGGANKTGIWNDTSDGVVTSNDTTSSDSSDFLSDSDNSLSQEDGMILSNSSIKTEDLEKMQKRLFSDKSVNIDDFDSSEVDRKLDDMENKGKLFSSSDDSILHMNTPSTGYKKNSKYY